MKSLELNQMEEFNGGLGGGACAGLAVALVGLGAASLILSGGTSAPMVGFAILSFAASCSPDQ